MTTNVTLAGEHLYYNIGSANSLATGNAATRADPSLSGLVDDSKTTTAGSILRAGVNYKF